MFLILLIIYNIFEYKKEYEINFKIALNIYKYNCSNIVIFSMEILFNNFIFDFIFKIYLYFQILI